MPIPEQHWNPETVELPTGLATEAAAGARFLLARLAADVTLQQLQPEVATSWAVYMLATAEHETWRSFAPVEEVGKGQGKPYGVALRTVVENGNYQQNVYYGRGYVQLTWQANYARIGTAIGLGRQLVEHPELALQPETAYAVMSYGMAHGAFTGVGLPRYLNATSKDYVNARRVINGVDCAQQIAELAVAWELRLSTGQPALQAAA